MKKLSILIFVILTSVLMSSCGVIDGGNYDSNRDGYLLKEDYIINYRTDYNGFLQNFSIDRIYSFTEALVVNSFDVTTLDDYSVLTNTVSVDELETCDEVSDSVVPRFIMYNGEHYYYESSVTCSYILYEFFEDGYDIEVGEDVIDVSPIETLSVRMFDNVDFNINPENDVLIIESIDYNALSDMWVRSSITPIAMSYRQAGELQEGFTDWSYQVGLLEKYVLENQSITLLSTKEDYIENDYSIIWSEDTVLALGKRHDIVRYVKIDDTGFILTVINRALERLVML